MKDNKEILSEAFFKKATYQDNKNKRLPQYTPADLKSADKTPFSAGAYNVVSTSEVQKRLAKTFGVSFGDNNVRSMASRAVKSFPIIVSDNIEPDTIVTLKKLVEDQYAEYINLLISNQMINLVDYRAGNETGNIAIQALEKISGTDFSSKRVANDAAETGSIKADNVFANIPLYQLLRENNEVIAQIDDEVTKSLLENACVVPSSYADDLVEAIQESFLNEGYYDSEHDYTPVDFGNRADIRTNNTSNRTTLGNYFMDIDGDGEYADAAITDRNRTLDARRGYLGKIGDKHVYTALTTADIVLDKEQLDQAINRSVGELLTRPENVEIRHRFEKATMLLQSKRISGNEYYQYCVLRLGIPVSEDVRQTLALKFPTHEVLSGRGVGLDGQNLAVITQDEVDAINSNRHIISKTVKNITQTKFRKQDFAKGALLGTSVGAAAGVGVGSVFTAVLLGPLFIGALAGCAVGGTGAYLLNKIKQNRINAKNKKIDELNKKMRTNPNIEGWERVEALINQWDTQQASIRAVADNNDNKPYISNTIRSYSDMKNYKSSDVQFNELDDEQRKTYSNYRDAIDGSQKMISGILKEAETFGTRNAKYSLDFMLSENVLDLLFEEMDILEEDINNDPMLKAELLSEGLFSRNKNTNNPVAEPDDHEYGDTYLTTQTVMDINSILKGNKGTNVAVRYIDKPEDKDVLITPQFMATDNYAYGTTEIERRENKDRRYNQPLIMKIKFRGRFQDDKFADNELTAVIGILGKVIRVPSKEMEYILQANAEGTTLDGFFKNSKGDLKNMITDLMSVAKINKDAKNLPQSADIWHNFEKVSTLAAANTISGKRSHNIANAHIIFSQKEIDTIRNNMGIDYLRDTKKSIALMKRYSAFSLMIANDPGQKLYTLDDQDAISWNVVPYNTLVGRDSGDQLSALINKMTR